ncbi:MULTISPECIES: hypothetical protein [Bacteroides]|uniref:hypothetical protein n=1 Tax=Bacteroides TaxID=816 RepID=UPI0018A09653|nr:MULTISPECIES: hypothetical protein [Bacteroides]MDC2611228.1 hypothetical protein [Bacteroides ovatus]MDC2630450.1 hypothetical protein [Bacteroides ovatus]
MVHVTFSQLVQLACGIDAHLKVVVARIESVGLSKETRSFAIFTSSLIELKEWLIPD